MSYFHLRGRGSVAGLCEGALSSAGPGRAEKEGKENELLRT